MGKNHLYDEALLSPKRRSAKDLASEFQKKDEELREKKTTVVTGAGESGDRNNKKKQYVRP